MFSKVLFSQTTKHRIEITYNLYANSLEDEEYLYDTKKIYPKSSQKLHQLINELNTIKSFNALFSEIGIDTLRILNNPQSLIKLYNEHNLTWNKQQLNYITEKLGNLETYKTNLAQLLDFDCCYHMHQWYRDEYIIELYKDGKLINTYTSRKSEPDSRKIPWKNQENEKNYNIKIDKIFFDLIDKPKSYHKLPNKSYLTNFLVKQLFRSHISTLYKLSAYDYSDELNELKSDFEILDIGEFFGRGRYIDYSQRTFYARLTNSKMLPNVNIMFSATEEEGKTIYSRAYIKNEYGNILDRVQNIEFIINYLKQNPSTQLDIYYFNDKPINDYNIYSFNKNPIEWKKQAKYIESLKWYEENNIEPSFDINKAIKSSEKIHCGCNYRFEKNFADQGIFIELKDEISEESSVWFLLPDNTVLLYIMQGEKVLNYDFSRFEEFPGMFPCILFDLKGNIIDRK